MTTDSSTGDKVKGKSKKWWGQWRDANGKLCRHPLSADKKAAQSMLNEIVHRVERVKAGLADPTDEQRIRPLKEHLAEFKAYLKNKDVTPKQILESTHQIEKMMVAGKWKMITDITATGALEFLGDRRHDRRALSSKEFRRLLDAARNGKRTEGISGPDRAMMYTLAAWTGFRKGEIGSLTPRSLDLDAEPPSATVAACYSKRRRQDTQILHPDVDAIFVELELPNVPDARSIRLVTKFGEQCA